MVFVFKLILFQNKSMVLETGEKKSCLPDFHCLRFVKKIYGGNLCSMVKKLFHFSYTAEMKQFMVISISIFFQPRNCQFQSCLLSFFPSRFYRVSSFWPKKHFPRNPILLRETPEFRKHFLCPPLQPRPEKHPWEPDSSKNTSPREEEGLKKSSSLLR